MYLQAKQNHKPMYQQVYDSTHTPKQIQSVIGAGGEGQVCAIAHGKNLILAKVYKQVKIERSQKLNFMMRCKQFHHHKRFAWPSCSIFSQKKEFIGYAMSPRHGLPLTRCFLPTVKDLGAWDRLLMVRTCLNIIEGLEELHQEQILVGDLNESNLLINPSNADVFFIDCDSYQIINKNHKFLCPVGRPEYLAPELQGLKLAQHHRELDQEVFAAGILLFKVLMLGQHPYTHFGGSIPSQNIRKGHFPYHTQKHIPKGPWMSLWNELAPSVQDWFLRLFVQGHKDRQKRPPLKLLKKALEEYQKSLTRKTNKLF